MINEISHQCDNCKQDRPYLVRVSYREIVGGDHYGEYAPRMDRYDWCLECLSGKMEDAVIAPELE
jgi:hypothetical protein